VRRVRLCFDGEEGKPFVMHKVHVSTARCSALIGTAWRDKRPALYAGIPLHAAQWLRLHCSLLTSNDRHSVKPACTNAALHRFKQRRLLNKHSALDATARTCGPTDVCRHLWHSLVAQDWLAQRRAWPASGTSWAGPLEWHQARRCDHGSRASQLVQRCEGISFSHTYLGLAGAVHSYTDWPRSQFLHAGPRAWCLPLWELNCSRRISSLHLRGSS
jgi:hypothetical protein